MSKAITHGNWTLEHMDGTPVMSGEMLETHNGDQYRITGGRPPHKPSSTGRVWVEGGGEFFPTVFDLRWMEFVPATLPDSVPRTPASQAMYIDEGGTRCPFCGSHDITGDEVNIDAGTAWQDVFCNDCSEEWQDTYTLTGYATTNK